MTIPIIGFELYYLHVQVCVCVCVCVCVSVCVCVCVIVKTSEIVSVEFDTHIYLQSSPLNVRTIQSQHGSVPSWQGMELVTHWSIAYLSSLLL